MIERAFPGFDSRATLESRWLQLTKTDLPKVAADRKWPIRYDHCFQRVFLDAACGGVWYDHIEGRPAYRAASTVQLERAVMLAEAALAEAVDLRDLNQQSLVWRGKSKG